MGMYTIADADVLIEKVKAARPTCSMCTKAAKPTFDGLWEPATGYKGWIRKCAKCANTPSFPWADKLEGFQVLAFMNAPQNVDRVWGYEELAAMVPQTEWDFMAKQIQHWKDRATKAEADLKREQNLAKPKLEDLERTKVWGNQWRDRALAAEQTVADMLADKKDRRTKRKEKDEALQSQLRYLQSQIDDLDRRTQ